MQSSKEVTRRAIEFSGPDRLPIEALSSPSESDIILVGSAPQYWVWKEISPGVEECVDENGCVRRRLGRKTWGEVMASPVETWDELDSFSFPPVPDAWEPDVADQVRRYPDKYVMGDLGLALYTVFDLRRMDNLLCDVALEPKLLLHLIDKIVENKLERIRRYATIAGIDAIAWYDDWGTQDRLLIAPQSWRSLFKAGYTTIVEESHRLGFRTYWHCCGYIWDILPDILDTGTDVLNLDQPRLVGIERLGDVFGGKICFSCPVDIQATLPLGDPIRAESEANLLIEKLGSFDGGFIGKVYAGSETDLNVQSNVIEAYLRAFRSYRRNTIDRQQVKDT